MINILRQRVSLPNSFVLIFSSPKGEQKKSTIFTCKVEVTCTMTKIMNTVMSRLAHSEIILKNKLTLTQRAPIFF